MTLFIFDIFYIFAFSIFLGSTDDDDVDKVRELYHWIPEEDGDGEELLKVKSTVTQFNVVSLPSFGKVSCDVLPVSGGHNHQGLPPLGAKLSRR